MLVIRFSRIGKKNYAQYKLVLAEKTYPIQGKFIEQLGSYDPHQKKAKLKKERINHWLEKGAQCSDSVHNLLVREEVIKGEKRFLKLGKKKKSGEEKEDSKGVENKGAEEVKKDEKKVEEKPEKATVSVEKKSEDKPEEKPEKVEESKKEDKAEKKPEDKTEEKK
jgi:small subunit ribosomal protein S16